MRPARMGVAALLLAVNVGFSFVVYRTSSSGWNEIKWRKSPPACTTHYLMYQNEPSTDCSLALKMAHQSWENEGRSWFTSRYCGETPTSSRNNDTINVVLWNHQGSGGNLATAYTWYTTSTGSITGFDIEVNLDVPWAYTTNFPGRDTCYDFQSILTHEFGHSLDLADLYWDQNRWKTMYGWGFRGAVNQRNPAQDDKDGIAYLYPSNAKEMVWLKSSASYDGGPSTWGDVVWESPDVQLQANPPLTGQPCSVRVTPRNMRPGSVNARVIIEAHDPELFPRPRGSIRGADTLAGATIPPGNADPDNDGSEEYANAKGDGETTYAFTLTPALNRFNQPYHSYLATVEAGTDSLPTMYVGFWASNNEAHRSFFSTNLAQAGTAETLKVKAGNQALDTTSRRLYLDSTNLPAGWHVKLVPMSDTFRRLMPSDTSVPLTVVVTPGSAAQPGDSGIVRIRCEMSYSDWPWTFRAQGGVTWKVKIGGPDDVGVTGITAPTGSLLQGAVVAPQATVKNFGGRTENFSVGFKISDGYSQDIAVTDLAPQQTTTVTFPNWTAVLGDYTTSCSTRMALDENDSNDKVAGSVQVRQGVVGDWSQLTVVPSGPAGKNVKDGGCLAFDNGSYTSNTSNLYALKGNNTCEFYQYNPGTNSWSTLTAIPLIGASGRKKAVKKGAALCATGGDAFAVKGNNSLELWRYRAGSWSQQADVPMGAKTIKEGAGLCVEEVGDTAFIFLLKGSATTEFYRYNPANNTWQTPASAPYGSSGKGFKNGSCIAGNGVGTVYALKATYNEFFAYSVAGNAWTTVTPLPLIGTSGRKKKAKDGAGLAFLTGRTYAMKGGNTREFYGYNPSANAWTQLNDLPAGGGRNVKGGGALVAGTDRLYALKGNNTTEFFECGVGDWSHGAAGKAWPAIANLGTWDQSSGVQLAPNPTLGSAVLQCRPGVAARLAVYDPSGRLVQLDRTSQGLFTIPALPAGIYLLKLSLPERTIEQKLVVTE